MNFVYALDAATGKAIASFGKDGRIDLREELGRDPAAQSIYMTSPAVKKRMAASRNGGTSWTPTRMAKKVDPQTK